MRDLNECKAEIFRRSHERIQKRKKIRNRVLACGIPFVLCIIVCSVTILPAIQSISRAIAGKTSAGMETVQSTGDSLECFYTCLYTEVRIQNTDVDPGYDRKVTDRVEVSEIYTTIQLLFDLANKADSAISEKNGGAENFDEYSSADALGGLTEYVITFTTEDGFETVYTFDKNELFNRNINERRVLTDTQAARLKEIIGISE